MSWSGSAIDGFLALFLPKIARFRDFRVRSRRSCVGSCCGDGGFCFENEADIGWFQFGSVWQIPGFIRSIVGCGQVLRWFCSGDRVVLPWFCRGFAVALHRLSGGVSQVNRQFVGG
jgi:hypothetical protein